MALVVKKPMLILVKVVFKVAYLVLQLKMAQNFPVL